MMTATHSQKGPLRYRYYVGPKEGSSRLRIPAGDLEAAVVQALRSALPRTAEDSDAALVATHLACLRVHRDRLELRLSDDRDPIVVPWSPVPSRRRRDIIVPLGSAAERLRPMKVEDRARILKAIATARRWMEDLTAGRLASPDALAGRENLTERSVRMTLSLAHLSPAIVRAILDARLPRGIGLRHLAELPAAWAEQEHALGL